MKERLTGAIILVVLIVLLVPELLSGPKHPAVAPAGASASPSEELPLRSYTINLDDSRTRTAGNGTGGPAMPQPSTPEQPTAQADRQPDSAGTLNSPPAAARPGTVAGSQASAAGARASTVPAAQASAPATSRPEAPQAHAQPRQTAAHTQQAQTPPRTQQAHAQQAQAASHGQQAHAQQSEASSHAQPGHAQQAHAAQVAHVRAAKSNQPTAVPTEAAAAHKSEPAAGAVSASGWAVQLGVFASRENAEHLALEVRVKGFKASVSPVSNGRHKLYRVRVGPTPDRDAAQELQSRLKAAGRPGGTVVPYSG